MTNLANITDRSRWRILAYWVTTGIIAAEFAFGGVLDVLQLPPLFEMLKRLGYPGYFAVILGVWKLLGAAAVLAPRLPRLEEWAYAGMFFTMTGAGASLVAPILFTGFVVASWALRSVTPPRRPLPGRRHFSEPHHRLLGHNWNHRSRVRSGRSDGRRPTITILRNHEVPGLSGILHDDHRLLVNAGVKIR